MDRSRYVDGAERRQRNVALKRHADLLEKIFNLLHLTGAVMLCVRVLAFRRYAMAARLMGAQTPRLPDDLSSHWGIKAKARYHNQTVRNEYYLDEYNCFYFEGRLNGGPQH